MKRRLVIVLTAILVLGLGIAVAAGGLGDPLISKSYLEGTYLSDLTSALEKRADTKTASTYTTAITKLDQLGEADLEAAEHIAQDGGAYSQTRLSAGDTLILKAGGSAILYAGQASLKTGTLADVTSGDTLRPGSRLSVHHRYIALEDTALSQTQSGNLGYQGSGSVQGKNDKTFPFTDVAKSSWYYDAVNFVFDRGYFSGVSETLFEPNQSMTRAMVATLLHRIGGNEKVTDTGRFVDVPSGQWFSESIAWASQKGIVNGMGEDRYEPDRPITREQIITMFYRYQKEYLKKPVSATGNLSGYPDGEKVSSWAKDALIWGTRSGLISGRDTGHLDPAGAATRAEVAAIVQRFSKLT